MKRFCATLLILGTLVLGTTSFSKEVIRSSRSNGSSIFNQKLSGAEIFQPGSMGTSRGERFQRRTTPPKFSIQERRDKQPEQSARIVTRKPKKSLREFPVVNLATTKKK